jgi:hypothetical protein
LAPVLIELAGALCFAVKLLAGRDAVDGYSAVS